MWSNPYVGALLYQSLLYLKTGLQYGTVILDVEGESFDEILEDVIRDFIDSGHMNKEHRDQFKEILYSQYVHNQAFHAPGKMNRRASIFNMDKVHLSSGTFQNKQADSSLSQLEAVTDKVIFSY